MVPYRTPILNSSRWTATRCWFPARWNRSGRRCVGRPRPELVPGALEQEAASIIERCARLIQQGVTCCVSTKRTVLTLPDDTPEAALVCSVAIRDALQSCVGKLPVTPAFVVAKGGITSSDVGVKALRVQCARVLGQIRPGIPVWQTGPESLFPGTPYVIFPGNVGEMSTLREAIEILLG